MKKNILFISLFVLLSLSSAKLFAQAAAFSFNPQFGCVPLTVAFTDLSTNATSWHWDFGNGDTSAIQNPTEVYSTQGVFIITLSINGGVSTASDTIVVDSIPMRPDTIFGTPYSCIGGGGVGMYYALPASGSANYFWDVPADAIILGSPIDSFIRVVWVATVGNIVVSAQNDCGSSSTVHINLAVVGLDTSITANASTLISNALFCTYQWIECPAMTILIGDTNNTFTPLVSGSYAVIINMEGCVDTSNCWSVIPTGVYSPEMNGQNINIFPNPTANTFTIKNISSNETSLLQIINLIGEVVYTEKYFKKNEYVVDANFAKGIYFVRVSDEVESVVRKLIVE